MIDYLAILDGWIARNEDNANMQAAELQLSEMVDDVADVCADGVKEAFRRKVDAHGNDLPAHAEVTPLWLSLSALLDDYVGCNIPQRTKIDAALLALLEAQNLAVNAECLSAVRKFKKEKGIK